MLIKVCPKNISQKKGLFKFFPSCHGENGKIQAVDLIHYIYDFKHYIYNSKQSFCQMDDSKHSILWPLCRRLKNCGHCSSWMMYRYTIKHFYSLMHCFKLYCIYFKSALCFVTIPLVDAATLFFTAAKETKELFSFSIII